MTAPDHLQMELVELQTSMDLKGAVSDVIDSGFLPEVACLVIS